MLKFPLVEFYQFYLDNIRVDNYNLYQMINTPILADHTSQSLRRLLIYEIFDTSLAAEERLRVDHVTMGSPGEGSFAGVNEPVSSLASVIPYVIERIRPSEKTRLINEGIRLDNEDRQIRNARERIAFERERIALQRERIELVKQELNGVAEFNRAEFHRHYGSSLGEALYEAFSQEIASIQALNSQGKIGAISTMYLGDHQP